MGLRSTPEDAVIAFVAAHSIGLGLLMLFLPGTMLRLTGWTADNTLFFPAQSGIFLLILGGACLAGAWHRPFAWFLVASKAAATVLLSVVLLVMDVPTILNLALVGDALMGIAVLIVLLIERQAVYTATTSGLA